MALQPCLPHALTYLVAAGEAQRGKHRAVAGKPWAELIFTKLLLLFFLGRELTERSRHPLRGRKPYFMLLQISFPL